MSWMCPQGYIVGTSGTQLLGNGPPRWFSPQGPSAPIFIICMTLDASTWDTAVAWVMHGVCKSLERGLVCEDSCIPFNPNPSGLTFLVDTSAGPLPWQISPCMPHLQIPMGTLPSLVRLLTASQVANQLANNSS